MGYAPPLDRGEGRRKKSLPTSGEQKARAPTWFLLEQDVPEVEGGGGGGSLCFPGGITKNGEPPFLGES